MLNPRFIIGFLALSFGLTFPLQGEDKLRVLVSVSPHLAIVEAIGGDWVEVEALQSEGDTCSLIDLRPSMVKRIARADLYFRSGAGLEVSVLDRIGDLNPDCRVVDLREGLILRRYQLEAPGEPGHDHGGGSHVAWDPHHWLDPVLVREQAGVIARVLTELRPEGADAFSTHLTGFQSRVDELTEELESRLKPYEGRAFFIYHPALGYFADRFGLEQVAMEDTSHQSSLKEMRRWIQLAREERVGSVVIQPQASRVQAETVANAIGAELVVVDPLAPDWAANLKAMAEALIRGWEKEE